MLLCKGLEEKLFFFGGNLQARLLGEQLTDYEGNNAPEQPCKSAKEPTTLWAEDVGPVLLGPMGDLLKRNYVVGSGGSCPSGSYVPPGQGYREESRAHLAALVFAHRVSHAPAWQGGAYDG